MAARRVSPRSSKAATTSKPRSFSRSLPRCAPGGRSCSSLGVMKCSSSAIIFIVDLLLPNPYQSDGAGRTAPKTTGPCRWRQTPGMSRERWGSSCGGLQTAFAADTVRPSTFHGNRMSDEPIAAIELHGPWFAALVQRLRELGWIEGRTVAIEYRWAEGRPERFDEIAAEF